MLKKTRLASILILSIMIIPVIFIQTASGVVIIEDYTNSPQPNPDSTWLINGFNKVVTSDKLSFYDQSPIDYDGSTGSNPYGYLPPAAYYDTDVWTATYFDPNDPGWLIFPVTPSYPSVGGGTPPYLPYTDDPAIISTPDIYSASYYQSMWNIVDDAEHVHYPRWEMQPFNPSATSSMWSNLILPYSITEVSKPFPRIEYTDPNFNYFGGDYDGVKFSMKIDSSYINDAIALKTIAAAGASPYDVYSLITSYPTIPNPSDWLELGHVSIIDSSNGRAGVNLGIVADPATGGFSITDSTFLNMLWDVRFTPGNPFAYINPSAPFLPNTGLITDIVANPADIKGTMLVPIPFYYTSGVTSYNLGRIDVISIYSVDAEFAGPIDASNYTLVDGGVSTDSISFLQDPPVGYPPDKWPLLDGEMFNVVVEVPSGYAGIANFDADTWYTFEIRVNWNSHVDWDPVLELRAYDVDGFFLGSWMLDSFFDQWIDFSQDMFYSEFAAPVPEGAYIPVITTPKSLMGIEGIKCTKEIPDLSKLPDWMDYLYAKTATAGWFPAYTMPSPIVNRTASVSFTMDFPPDSTASFDPQTSDYGAHVLEIGDPANSSNFIEIIMAAHPMYITQTLDDIDTGIIDNVTLVVVIMDGDLQDGGLPKPSTFFAFSINDDYPTNISVEWDVNNDYTCTFEGINSSNELDAWSFSGNANWSDPMTDKTGMSDVFTYICDGGYNVTMGIRSVSIEFGDPPIAPVVETPTSTTYNGYSLIDVDWNDVTNADNYTIYWQIDGGSAASATVPDSDFTLNATVNGNYSFWVETNNETGYSDPSNTVWININITDVGISDSLSILSTVVDVPSNAFNVTLDWSWISGSEEYNVYRSPDNATFTMIGTTDISYYVDQVTSNGTWYYRVTGVNGTVEGGQSNTANKTITLYLPGSPTVSVNSTPSATGIFILRWNRTINGQRYLVYGSNSSTVDLIPSNLVANITGTGITVQQTTNGTYYYVVVAVSTQGFLAQSSLVTVVVAIEPPPAELSFLEQIVSFIVNIISAIITFILSILGLALVYKTRRRTPKDCIGGQCNV